MKKIFNSAFLLLFAVFFTLQGYGKNIHYITNKDGLSNSSVNCIYQDSLGLLWIGTWDGLNRYNSKDFRIFKPVLTQNSISNNIIRNIIEEKKGILWITTDFGINRYDAIKDEFETYFCNNIKNSVFQENSFHICKDNRNRIFTLVNEYGFFYYDPEKNDFISLGIDFRYNLKTMVFDHLGNLWFLSEQNEIYKISFENTPISVKPIVKDIRKIAYKENFYCLYFDAVNHVFITQTFSKDIFQINSETETIEKNPWQLDEWISTLCFSDKEWAIGTLNGLYRYSPDTHTLRIDIEDIQVLSLLEGSQDILWIGTDTQGVIKHTRKENNFNAYTLQPNSVIPVRAFMEGKDSTLFIGTKWKGLYIINNQGKPLETENIPIQKRLLNNTINALGTANGHTIWICAEEKGLNYYDLNKKEIKNLTGNNKFNLENAFSIYVQNDTTLWVGTNGLGFYKIIVNSATNPYSVKTFTQYSYKSSDSLSLNNNIIYSIRPNGETHLWIGTRGGGLNLFDIENESFIRYQHDPENPHSISNDDILCLYTDKKGYLWAGTSIGLNKLVNYNNNQAVFKRYTEKDGIPNNTIHGILEDKNGSIWISTNKGLAQLSTETNKIIIYDQTDGLQDNEYSDGAYYSSPYTDEFYFGGISGFTRFNPSTISRKNYLPILYLNECSINNKDTFINIYNYTNVSPKLNIDHNDNFFSFDFTPIDYISGTKCELVYKLENYDKEWINIGLSRTIVYSNLPAGNYILKAKCSNVLKEWSHEYIIPIRIHPPWWSSKYAYLTYMVILVLTLYFIYISSRNRVYMQHQLELKNLEKKKTEEIHQAKLRFFTNIAHEFCNSLTLIYGPTEHLLKKNRYDTGTEKYLRVIQSNAERMQELIQQLMEFRKAETGYLELHIESLDITELINYISDNFSEIAEEKNIDFNIHISKDISVWNTDKGAFEKIIFNLFSNAFKYTPVNGYVNLSAIIQENKLILTITNSGQGIKEEEKELIFNRFKVLDSFESQITKGAETRTGIGLALCRTLIDLLKGEIYIESELNQFTAFIITLPLLPVTMEQKETLSTGYTTENKVNGNKKQKKRNNIVYTGNSPSVNKQRTILIVDDDRAIRDLLVDILSSQYKMLQAANGKEALEILQNQLPHLIICDIIMPEMNGVELVEKIKSLPMVSHIPIILLSSDNSVDKKIKGIKTGADAYLTKPFHSEHLEVMIEQLLTNKENLKRYFDSPISSIENWEGKKVHKEEKDFIIKLTQIIHEHLSDENFSLEILSRKMCMSKIQIYRKLKEIKNETPTEYIRCIRLKQAEKLLKTTNKTVQEIMFMCGFNNKAYFYRQFTKKYHQTPKEYRSKFNDTTQ